MNETVLTWIVFILAFGGMVLIHELGHYIAARMSNVEVEEFGIGLPTPGALTLWINKGYLVLKSGKRVEVPFNFRLPLNSSDLTGRQTSLTVDQVEGLWVLRSMEVVIVEESRQSSTRPLEADHIYVDQTGAVAHQQEEARQPSKKILKAGKKRGEMELQDTILEVHPGTRFTLNWLPLGGFVRPKGENDPNVPGGLAAASPWKRLFVLVSGPMMNLLTAVVIYAIIFSRVGVPDTSRVLVASVSPESPAAAAGFQDGDIFLNGNGQPIRSYDELRVIVDGNIDQPVEFLIQRGGEQVELTAIPRMNDIEKRAMIGVGLGVPFKQTTSWTETLGLGARYTGYTIRALLSLPAQMIRGTAAPEAGRLIGLKGIFDILEQSVAHDVQATNNASSEGGLAPVSTDPIDQPVRTLELLASLSISLGVFNLLPFPALDGGRILFILPELIFRRRVSPRIENLVHGMGMAFLLLFMLYVNLMDFINPITVTIP
ncbi:MAG TPA: site-2 protease family protein [Anaerolineales bacterium]|nr:site-2 protease family protein [Anaerolineales bacterium]